jgi:hypothetical protein
MKPLLKYLSIFIFSLLVACGQNGFTNEEIIKMKEAIKAEFEGRGPEFKVTEIELIIESPKKVSGFVKVKAGDDDPVMLDCNATMGNDRKYIWKCE